MYMCNFNPSDMRRKHFNNQCFFFPVFLDSEVLSLLLDIFFCFVRVLLLLLFHFLSTDTELRYCLYKSCVMLLLRPC